LWNSGELLTVIRLWMCASAESSTTCSMASFIRPEVALIIGSVALIITAQQLRARVAPALSPALEPAD